MDDNAMHALIMAFGLFILVLALSLSVYMLSLTISTSESLIYYTDTTRYYDNIETTGETERYVGTETVIPVLYRYYKENFCVKIYDGRESESLSEDTPELLQVFDVNIEGLVNKAVADTDALNEGYKPSATQSQKQNYALNQIYNTRTSNLYLFGAPWIGSTDNMKLRVDYFINGLSGYINNQLVDYSHGNTYSGNAYKFSEAIEDGAWFKEKFISYSYSGQTYTDEDTGDTFVTGAAEKDKIVIIYTIVDPQ